MFDARKFLSERWRINRQQRCTSIASVLSDVADAPSASLPTYELVRSAPIREVRP